MYIKQEDKQVLFDMMKDSANESGGTQITTDDEFLDDIQYRIEHDNSAVGLASCYIANFKSKWEN